jgi:hypothetical protein
MTPYQERFTVDPPVRHKRPEGHEPTGTSRSSDEQGDGRRLGVHPSTVKQRAAKGLLVSQLIYNDKASGCTHRLANRS